MFHLRSVCLTLANVSSNGEKYEPGAFFARRVTLLYQIEIALILSISYALSIYLCNTSTVGHRRSTVNDFASKLSPDVSLIVPI